MHDYSATLLTRLVMLGWGWFLKCTFHMLTWDNVCYWDFSSKFHCLGYISFKHLNWYPYLPSNVVEQLSVNFLKYFWVIISRTMDGF